MKHCRCNVHNSFRGIYEGKKSDYYEQWLRNDIAAGSISGLMRAVPSRLDITLFVFIRRDDAS